MIYNGDKKNLLDNFDEDLNRIENQINLNRNFGNLDERLPEYFQRDMMPNEDYIKQIVKLEFYSLISPFQQYQQKIAELSKNLKNKIKDNNQKIKDIENKLYFLKSPNSSLKNSFSDNDNFLKKNEFEFKMKEIKEDIMRELNNPNNNKNQNLDFSLSKIQSIGNEVNELKYNYDYIKSQIEFLMKGSNINYNSISKNEVNQLLSNNKEELKNKISVLKDEIEKFKQNYISNNAFQKKLSGLKEMQEQFQKELSKEKKAKEKLEKKISDIKKELELKIEKKFSTSENLKKILSDFKNEINPKIENAFLAVDKNFREKEIEKKISDIKNELEQKIEKSLSISKETKEITNKLDKKINDYYEKLKENFKKININYIDKLSKNKSEYQLDKDSDDS